MTNCQNSKYEFHIGNIQPSRAAEFLKKRNSFNREIKESKVAYLCDVARSGNWIDWKARVTLDKDGIVIDGQHTLTAIVETGMTLPVTFTVGASNDDMLKIDLDNRTIEDQLKIMGIDKYTTAIGTYLRFRHNYPEYVKTGDVSVLDKTLPVSKVVEVYGKEREFIGHLLPLLHKQANKASRASLMVFAARVAVKQFGEGFVIKMVDKILTSKTNTGDLLDS